MRNEAPYEVIPRAASSSPSFHHLPRRATPPSKYSHQVITLDCRTSENRHLISRLSTLAPRPPTTTSASAHADYQTMPKSQGSRPELPPNHPVRRLQQPGVRLALLLLSPFVALALVLWGVVGWFLTLPPRSVAVVTVAGSWVLYLCIPDIPVRLIDWPIVLTVAMALGVVLPVKPVGRANRGAVRAAHLVLSLGMIVYGVLRVSLTDLKDGTTEKHIVDALAVLCCVTPAWLAICSLKLWLPADEQLLEEFERKVYEQYIVTEFSLLKVAGLGTVHVPYCGEATHVPPRNLVLVHGYLAGNGFWAANLQALAKCFNVYAVEWKGIGRSDRPKFNPKTDKEMDDFFVESLEDWRREIQLDRFILCGHSMGGMYATYYSEKYSQHIEHMILVSPAGVNSSGVKPEELNWFIRLAATFYITPMSIVRFTGPYGLRMVQWIMRSRIAWTPPTNIIRSGELDFDLITAYCYHNWALGPSGDRAVYTHLHPGASAPRRSLDSILVPGKIQVPLTIMYGGGPDWMNSEYGRAVIERLENVHYAKFRLVPLSGHQVFMDNPTDFNSVLIDAVREEERSSGFNN